jgi:hypothetical protein
MRHWPHRGGFSVDASVRVEAWDRAGLERLVRYAARPPFALNRLSWTDGKIPSLLYTPPRPLPDGRTALHLTPLELLRATRRAHPTPSPAPPPLSRRVGPPFALPRTDHRQRRASFRANTFFPPGLAAFLTPRAGRLPLGLALGTDLRSLSLALPAMWRRAAHHRLCCYVLRSCRPTCLGYPRVRQDRFKNIPL